jgi:hypothetical protein
MQELNSPHLCKTCVLIPYLNLITCPLDHHLQTLYH